VRVINRFILLCLLEFLEQPGTHLSCCLACKRDGEDLLRLINATEEREQPLG
jgi:hypothetical protein